MFRLSPQIQRFAFPIAAVIIMALAWRAYGLQGIFVAASGLVLVVLLHFTRLMHIMRKAADRPIGYVGSAVMLNAKLKPNVSLVHVMALTKSLGEQRTPRNEQPEIFRWTDGSESYVDCEFVQGKLVRWTLTRPTPPQENTAATDATDAVVPSSAESPKTGT